jgi:gluconolactonase
MSVEVRDERFHRVVGSGDAELETLGDGYVFTEGPAWHPYKRHLTFSDIPTATMHRWDAATGAIAQIRDGTYKTNGNTYDAQGRLLSCEHVSSRVTRAEPDGSRTVLATHYDGRQLNSPNDIVVHSDGDIWFTDPASGRRFELYGEVREQDLDFQGVFRMHPDGSDLTLIADDFETPNGLCFSRDERHLFVNDTARGHIRRFDVAADGSVSGGAVWAAMTGEDFPGVVGVPDGMKIDSDGNLYCTGPGGIQVFAADATCLGVIRIPCKVGNFTFGGDDMRDLFVTASGYLLRTRVQIPGRRLF